MPLLSGDVAYQEKTLLELAKAGLYSGEVLVSSGLFGGILLYFI